MILFQDNIPFPIMLLIGQYFDLDLNLDLDCNIGLNFDLDFDIELELVLHKKCIKVLTPLTLSVQIFQSWANFWFLQTFL